MFMFRGMIVEPDDTVTKHADEAASSSVDRQKCIV